MKIFGILLILCVSKAYSAIGGNIGIGGQLRGNIGDVARRIICHGGTIAGNIVGDVSPACKNLPGQSARKGCTKAANAIDKASKELTKYCNGGSSTNAQAPTTQSTSTKAPTTQSTSTPAPTTTVSPDACKKDQMQTCTNICDRYRQTSIVFGPICTKLDEKENSGASFHCDCEKVTHCETYQNATCTSECQDKKICRIPDRGLPCVCIINPGKPYKYYVLPSQL